MKSLIKAITLIFLLSITSLTITCPTCQKQNLISRVYQITQSDAVVATPAYYDEAGKYVAGGSQTISCVYFICSKHHAFSIQMNPDGQTFVYKEEQI